MKCAMCNEKKDLCRSVTINGIPKPRICKECLMDTVRNGYDENKIDLSTYAEQIEEWKRNEKV